MISGRVEGVKEKIDGGVWVVSGGREEREGLILRFKYSLEI